jgi:protein translocase SecG subunit
MEFIKGILPLVQVLVSVLLVALILLQRSGSELGGAFGGGDGSGGTLYTRRGFERVVFFSTIAVSTLFVLINLAALLLG